MVMDVCHVYWCVSGLDADWCCGIALKKSIDLKREVEEQTEMMNQLSFLFHNIEQQILLSD